MAQTVYVETSVISLLASRPSRDVVVAGRQATSWDFCERHRTLYSLCISQFVLDEIAVGDADAARRRLQIVRDLPLLAFKEEVRALAERFVRESAIPERARLDATHVAIAAVHGIDFVITWNLKHIAHAVVRRRFERVGRDAGYVVPVLCTPEELMGEFEP